MAIGVLKLPDVKPEAESRPARCPTCKGETFQRWGGQTRQVRDPQIQSVRVYRYRCCSCRHTFRHYPAGVDPAQQTQRLRKLAALCWVLGLSYRGIETVFSAFGVNLGRMSAWRDVQAWNEQLQKRRQWQPVRVLGLDGAYVRGWGETRPVLVAVDLGSGQPVALGVVDEKDPRAVRRFLKPLVQRLGVSVIVTDDLHSYRQVAEQLDLEQQVCQFHVRRWVGRTIQELQKTLPADGCWILAEVKRLVATLPKDGGKELFALWKQVPERRAGREEPRSPLDQLRQLLIRLSEHWQSYRGLTGRRRCPGPIMVPSR